MKLIHEDIDFGIENFVRESKEGRNYYIEGPFIQTEIVNRNKRKYLRNVMEQEVENYLNEMVNNRRSIGELGHPETPALSHERACILIESLTPQGNDWIGKAKVFTSGDLPKGRIVKGLIDEGVQFGVSTRGVGSLVKRKNGITIVENYRLSTAADVVADPSAPNAFVNGIMENVEWIFNSVDNNFKAQEIIEQVREERHVKKIDESKALKLFESFMKTLK